VNLRRLRAVLHFALREVLLLRAGWIGAVTVLAILGTGDFVGAFHFGPERARFVFALGRGVLLLGGSALAVLTPVLLLGNAWRGGTAQIWLARGVRREEWLLAQFGAVAVLLIVFVLVCGAALAWTVSREGGVIVPTAFVAELAFLAVRLGVVAAGASLLAVLCRRPLLALALGFGFALAAELAPVIELVAVNSVTGLRLVWAAAAVVLPNFQTQGAGSALCQLAGYLATAAMAFSRREF
jgi:hypothetical protein